MRKPSSLHQLLLPVHLLDRWPHFGLGLFAAFLLDIEEEGVVVAHLEAAVGIFD